jgi:rare lipoprotein A
MRAPGLRLPIVPTLALALLATPILATTAYAATDPAPNSHETTVSAATTTWTESGEASWYGPGHEGRRTTSGERFDSRKLTAAHPTLPLGSYVRVTLQETGQSIIVRVNDREPPHGVRCIDLSRAAAARLGIVNRGVADVTLEQVAPREALAQVAPGEASKDATELAEAPDDATDVEAPAGRHLTAPHGPRHKRHAHQ